MEKPHPTASVFARSRVEITAEPREVWSVLADIDGWPTWNPAVRAASLEGDLEVGTYFRWAAGTGTITSQLSVVDAPARLAWSGAFMTLKHHHSWNVEIRPSGSLVTVEEAISGLVARLLSRRLGRTAQQDLDTWVGLLKLEAEARHVDAGAEVEVEVADRPDAQPPSEPTLKGLSPPPRGEAS